MIRNALCHKNFSLTALMGNDPKDSVLNKWNQMQVSNVFVTDGSCTSIACQNPSLTFMALTARAADYAVKELKKEI
jgi:choline dehydrogenase-like flavoprotein